MIYKKTYDWDFIDFNNYNPQIHTRKDIQEYFLRNIRTDFYDKFENSYSVNCIVVGYYSYLSISDSEYYSLANIYSFKKYINHLIEYKGTLFGINLYLSSKLNPNDVWISSLNEIEKELIIIDRKLKLNKLKYIV